MKPQHVKTVRELVARGMAWEKAMDLVGRAFALSSKEMAELDKATQDAA